MGKNLVIACGGTGGHFYPTVSIARAFMDMGGNVTLLVAGKNAASQIQTAAEAGINAREVGFIRRPAGILEWLTLPFRYLKIKQATRKIIDEIKPDVALGMGSYASVATCKALPGNVPLILHEGNAFMGKANRMFAKRAGAIGLSLPLMDEGQLKGTEGHLVGMPLRESLAEAAKRNAPAEGWLESQELEQGVFTVLVFGGSQGAQRINQLLCETAGLLNECKVQFIHLTGTDDNAAIKEAYRKAGLKASVRKADYHIEECYLAADLVICRGGASSLCELALFKKPAVIIPLPTAADDHQSANAKLAESTGGAIHLPQKEATPGFLAGYISDAAANPDKSKEMGQKLGILSRTDSALEMARLIFNS